MTTGDERVYLDNAATSWPKPPGVAQAMLDAMQRLGAPVGRSTYREAAEVERLVDTARARIAQLIHAPAPERIIFTFNGTDSLNLALHGLLQPGDHVITSVMEHNSVLRPLRELQLRGGVEVTRVPCDEAGVIDPDQIRRAICAETKLIALIHASNVTGAVQPIESVARVAKEHGVLLLVDAAQSLGHVPIDVSQLEVDLLAAPGHKGLLGPLGTGLLYIGPGVEEKLRPVRQGGTGTRSEEDRQPDSLPDKYEAGNHNVPGLAGLSEGVAFVLRRGIDQLCEHVRQLTRQLLDGLMEIGGVTIYGPASDAPRAPVVSITIDGWEPQAVASLLDENYRIQVRAGIHCAPLAHRHLGTLEQGGTIRFSIGPFNTTEQIDRVIEAVAEIARESAGSTARHR